MSASDLCPRCGHERGEHTSACEKGWFIGEPCGCPLSPDEIPDPTLPVSIPLPPEPPRDRTIEAVEGSEVVERFAWSDGEWKDEDGNPWDWQRHILSIGARNLWTLRHVAAESGEQT